MSRKQDLETPIGIVSRQLLDRAGETPDRHPRVANHGSKGTAGRLEFALRRFGLGPDLLSLGQELDEVEPGKLLVLDQGDNVLHLFIDDADEFVQHGDAPFESVQVVVGGADRADDRVSFSKECDRRLIDLGRDDRLGKSELFAGDELLG